jgi:hypothetical protein
MSAQPQYWEMSRFLSRVLGRSMTKKNLLLVAREIAAARGAKLDRLAKRSKEVLILWFCENALDILGNPRVPAFATAVSQITSSEAPEPRPPKLGVTFPSLSALGVVNECLPDDSS